MASTMSLTDSTPLRLLLLSPAPERPPSGAGFTMISSNEEEADIFANQLKIYQSTSSPYEIFMANVEVKTTIQLTIKALVESYDLVLSAKSAPGNICAISTVEDIYEKYGFHVLDRTLRLIVQTWEGEQKSFSANMLSGVARLVNCFGDTMKDTLFIEKLGMISIRELSRTAKDRHAGSLGYSEAMLIFYNKKNTGGIANRKAVLQK